MTDAAEPIFEDEEASDVLTDKQTYNVVSDTVTGVNFRVKDNVVQAISIFVCLVLGAIIGAFVVEEWIPGALVGAFIGLVAGLLGSGIVLMIYRFVMHIRGHHD